MSDRPEAPILGYAREVGISGILIDETPEMVCVRIRIGAEPNRGVALMFAGLTILCGAVMLTSIASKGLTRDVIPIGFVGILIFGLLAAVAMTPVRLRMATITASSDQLEFVDPVFPIRSWHRSEIASIATEPLLEISPNGPRGLVVRTSAGDEHRLMAGLAGDVESAAGALRRILRI